MNAYQIQFLKSSSSFFSKIFFKTCFFFAFFYRPNRWAKLLDASVLCQVPQKLPIFLVCHNSKLSPPFIRSQYSLTLTNICHQRAPLNMFLFFISYSNVSSIHNSKLIEMKMKISVRYHKNIFFSLDGSFFILFWTFLKFF